jgi:hypothetical protein
MACKSRLCSSSSDVKFIEPLGATDGINKSVVPQITDDDCYFCKTKKRCSAQKEELNIIYAHLMCPSLSLNLKFFHCY